MAVAQSYRRRARLVVQVRRRGRSSWRQTDKACRQKLLFTVKTEDSDPPIGPRPASGAGRSQPRQPRRAPTSPAAGELGARAIPVASLDPGWAAGLLQLRSDVALLNVRRSESVVWGLAAAGAFGSLRRQFLDRCQSVFLFFECGVPRADLRRWLPTPGSEKRSTYRACAALCLQLQSP